ncbi:MAG: hypothetical protein WCW32_03280, partial [Candidatus Paceibacterota bacterium]
WLQREKIGRGCSSAACYQTNSWVNQQDCSATNQTCSGNQCGPSTGVFASCYASPASADVNQNITFISSASGGNGSYSYSWSNACTGSNTNCTNSFSTSGTKTANLVVTSGGSSTSASCSVNILGGSDNDYQQCYNNDLYWYNSQGVRQGISQDCGESYCSGNGYNYCSGNAVYQQKTCYNKGCASNACYSTSYTENQLVQVCAAGQVCQNGYCTNNNVCECTTGPCCDGCHYRNSSMTCNSDVQTEYGCPWGSTCGADVGVRTKTRYQYCTGYSASCSGSWGGWQGLTGWRIADFCSTKQACSTGSPICLAKSSCGTTPPYVFRYRKACFDNDVYWYDSRGSKQDKDEDCTDTNSCTLDSCDAAKCANELVCDGTTCAKDSADYGSFCSRCGDDVCDVGETMATCPQDCNVIGLAVTIMGKKEKDSIEWTKIFSASASQGVDFLLVVSNGLDITMNNVTLSTNLPQEVVYKGGLQLDGVPYAGDILSSISLGSLPPKAVRTLTFKGQIVGANDIHQTETDAIAIVNTSEGSSTDSVRITLQGSNTASNTTTNSIGGLASLLNINLKSPLYILLLIIIGILVLLGISRIFQGFGKKA